MLSSSLELSGTDLMLGEARGDLGGAGDDRGGSNERWNCLEAGYD
jgi:hypothetical protein